MFPNSSCPETNGVRTEARDFFERPIEKGDFVVYPTGGTSCRMVLGKVLDVANMKNGNSTHDGLRGKSNKRIIVLRIKEGADLLGANKARPDYDPQAYYNNYGVESERKQSVHQLHRVVVISRPDDVMEQVARNTGIVE